LSRVVVLDSGPLATVTHRGGVPPVDACKRWLSGLLQQGVRVVVPEIADYETRRELLRAGKIHGLARLDALEEALEYLPLTTASMRLAAQLWAEVRRQGQQTADDKALDGDVILAAQAPTMGVPEDGVVVATSNVGHLSRLISAEVWQQIR
jgi:predicted nucleic acid-binding protein